MLSAIERAKKTAKISVPSQWNTVIQTARTAAPLNHEDSWNFKNVATSRFCDTKTDIQGDRVNWLPIKWHRYLREDQETLLFKYMMADDFKQLKIKGTSTRGRQTSFSLGLPHRYSGKLLLSEVQKKDLLDLCHMGVAPQEYHCFYKPYPVASSHQIACLRRT